MRIIHFKRLTNEQVFQPMEESKGIITKELSYLQPTNKVSRFIDERSAN